MKRGCNILTLSNCQSADTVTADEICSLVYRRHTLGSLLFKDVPVTNGQSYCILEFFQPSFHDQLEIKGFTDDLLAKKPYLRKELTSAE